MVVTYKLLMTADEVSEYVSEVFPQSDEMSFVIEQLLPGEMSISLEVQDRHLRPGGTVSGPTMFSMADLASYLLTLAHIGKVALAVTTNLNINFVSKPDGDLIAHAKFIKLGKRLSVTEISIHTRADNRLVAHATATYSIPPDR